MLSPLARATSRPHGRVHLGRPLTLLLAGLVGIGGLVAVPTAAVAGDGQATISGRVTDTAGNPLENICVNLEIVGTGTIWQVRTDPDGRYLSEVNPGDFTANFLPCSSSGYPIEEWYDGATLETADTFTATAGQETTGIDASMVIGGQVTGTVRNDDGAALQGICVDLLDQTGKRVKDPSVTGRAGTYKFRDVPPDTYFIGFRNCRDIGPYADEFFQDATSLAEATPVVVAAAHTPVADGVLERVTPPDTTIVTGPADGSTINTSTPTFTFAGTPADAAVSFVCQIDTGSPAPCTSPMRLTSLTQGTHTFSVYALGRAGTVDASPATRTFQVRVPVVVPPRSPKATTKLTLSAPSKVRQGTKVKVRVRLDGVANGTVVIRDGRKIVRTIKVKGKATIKLRLTKVGKHRLSASYSGTKRAKPAKSAVRTIVVRRKR